MRSISVALLGGVLAVGGACATGQVDVRTGGEFGDSIRPQRDDRRDDRLGDDDQEEIGALDEEDPAAQDDSELEPDAAPIAPTHHLSRAELRRLERQRVRAERRRRALGIKDPEADAAQEERDPAEEEVAEP